MKFQNITYFESSTVSAGSCTAQVCPISNNICQMRLDFNTFMIMGPSTKSTSDVKITGGVGVSRVLCQAFTTSLFKVLHNIFYFFQNAEGKTATVASQCLTDRFIVTSTGPSSPPVICGTNSGEHSEFTKYCVS